MNKILFIVLAWVYFGMWIMNGYLLVSRIQSGKDVFLEGVAIWCFMWGGLGFVLGLHNPWK